MQDLHETFDLEAECDLSRNEGRLDAVHEVGIARDQEE
jgi:hypothetical protein